MRSLNVFTDAVHEVVPGQTHDICVDQTRRKIRAPGLSWGRDAIATQYRELFLVESLLHFNQVCLHQHNLLTSLTALGAYVCLLDSASAAQSQIGAASIHILVQLTWR